MKSSPNEAIKSPILKHESRGNTPTMGFLGNLVSGAIESRVMVIFVTLLASALGVLCFLQLHIDAVPDVSNTRISHKNTKTSHKLYDNLTKA